MTDKNKLSKISLIEIILWSNSYTKNIGKETNNATIIFPINGSFFKIFTPFWKTNFEILMNHKLKLGSSKKYSFYNKAINFNLKIHELKLH
mgnify:CR=1 FL=1